MYLQLHSQTDIKVQLTGIGQQEKHLNDVLNCHQMHEQHLANKFRVWEKEEQSNYPRHSLRSLETIQRRGGDMDSIQ